MGGLTESAIEFLQIRKNVDPTEYLRDVSEIFLKVILKNFKFISSCTQLPDSENKSNLSVFGHLKSILLNVETRYIYPCVLSHPISSTSLSTTAFSVGDNAPHEEEWGASKCPTVEEQQEMEMGSQVSSGGGQFVHLN